MKSKDQIIDLCDIVTLGDRIFVAVNKKNTNESASIPIDGFYEFDKNCTFFSPTTNGLKEISYMALRKEFADKEMKLRADATRRREDGIYILTEAFAPKASYFKQEAHVQELIIACYYRVISDNHLRIAKDFWPKEKCY